MVTVLSTLSSRTARCQPTFQSIVCSQHNPFVARPVIRCLPISVNIRTHQFVIVHLVTHGRFDITVPTERTLHNSTPFSTGDTQSVSPRSCPFEQPKCARTTTDANGTDAASAVHRQNHPQSKQILISSDSALQNTRLKVHTYPHGCDHHFLRLSLEQFCCSSLTSANCLSRSFQLICFRALCELTGDTLSALLHRGRHPLNLFADWWGCCQIIGGSSV